MFKVIKCLIFMAVLLLMNGCVENNSDKLYDSFVNPLAKARPFVRWWWNGNCVEEDEIKRELDVMKAAGIGGGGNQLYCHATTCEKDRSHTASMGRE